MNSDVLHGKWNQIKGDVKKSFGKLTDNDMMVLEGDATKAVGLLQERYGYTREDAEKHWGNFTKRIANAADGVVKDLNHAVDSHKASRAKG